MTMEKIQPFEDVSLTLKMVMSVFRVSSSMNTWSNLLHLASSFQEKIQAPHSKYTIPQNYCGRFRGETPKKNGQSLEFSTLHCFLSLIFFKLQPSVEDGTKVGRTSPLSLSPSFPPLRTPPGFWSLSVEGWTVDSVGRTTSVGLSLSKI